MTKLSITREGEFIAIGESPVQCRESGWKGTYKWRVSIEATHLHLTKEGWIVDNRSIQSFWDSEDARIAESCEGYAQKGLRGMQKLCAECGVSPKRIHVRVWSSEVSWFDAEWPTEEDFAAMSDRIGGLDP